MDSDEKLINMAINSYNQICYTIYNYCIQFPMYTNIFSAQSWVLSKSYVTCQIFKNSVFFLIEL